MNPKTGIKQSSAPPPNQPMNVSALRQHLRSVGYDIPAEGKTIGSKMKSALADYLQVTDQNTLSPAMAKLLKGTAITGRRDSKAWSAKFGSPKSRPVVQTTQVGSNGNMVVDAPAAGAVAGATGVDFSSLFAGVSAPSASPIPTSWAQGGAKLFDPSMAGKLAGLQFDGQIGEAERLGREAPLETKQHLADVGNWYGQVLKSQGTASGRDAAMNDAAVGSIKDAGASILSAIGGQASQGAGMVGAANSAAVGTLEALGSNQEAYNNDIRPLLEAESAGAKTRESVRGSNRAKELADKLLGLQADKGRAESGFQFQVDQANNGILDNRNARAMQIRESNNGLAQQNFQNALASVNAQLGAAMTGVDIQTKMAELAGGRPGAATTYSFAKAPVSQKDAAYNQALSSIFDGSTLTMNVPQAVQQVNKILASLGWNRSKDDAVMALRNQILRDAGIRPDPRWR